VLATVIGVATIAIGLLQLRHMYWTAPVEGDMELAHAHPVSDRSESIRSGRLRLFQTYPRIKLTLYRSIR
jgi:hypothetical protein